MEYLDESFQALYFLFRAYIAYMVFVIARHLTKQSTSPRWLAYLWTLAVVMGFTLVSWYTYGTHVENDDPIHGGGETIIDFVSTDEERNKHGVFIFTALLVPSLIGTYKGLEERARRETQNS